MTNRTEGKARKTIVVLISNVTISYCVVSNGKILVSIHPSILNQSINQSIDQSINQSISHLVYLSIMIFVKIMAILNR